MKRMDLPDGGNMWLLKFSASDMPHGTIETNRTCNIRCDNCYNVAREYEKPFDRIAAEVDILASRRKVQTITLMGGEPTLHPDLPAIVAYVKNRGIRCQILTNGIAFLGDPGAALLAALRRSGVDRITLHVDKGQHGVRSGVDAVRRRLFELLESMKINFALSITIDSAERAVIPGIVKTYAEFRYFDGVVGFMASGLLERKYPGAHLKAEADAIAGELALAPTGYIPSNLDDNEIRWLLYYFMIDSRTGKVYPLSPRSGRIFCEWFRKITGRFPFTLHLHPVLSALTALSAIIASPGRFFTKKSGAAGFPDLCASVFSTRFFYIVFQVPPEFEETTTAIELCDHCPDATIRNGKLLPLCLADFISPFDPSGKVPEKPDEKFNKVVEYLNPPDGGS